MKRVSRGTFGRVRSWRIPILVGKHEPRAKLDPPRLCRQKQALGKSRFFTVGGEFVVDVESGDQSQPPKKQLSAAAERALAEAEARRAVQKQIEPTKEIQGRQGPEPVRYGDWEVKGLATDF